MSTIIRPSISEKNEWYIEKHRYYELKHFCLQYPTWEKKYNMADGIERSAFIFVDSKQFHDPTAKCAEIKAYYSFRMDMLKKAAYETDPVLGIYILRGILEERSYDTLKALYNIPCCKDIYYKLYRKFFWLLSQERE